MVRSPLPPIAAAISFVDCINRGDLGGLTELMTDDEEMRLSVIWLAHAVDGRLSSWRVAADTPGLRAQLGIPRTV